MSKLLAGIKRKEPVRRFMVRLPVEVNDKMREIAKAENTSVNEIVIAAVKHFLVQLKRQKKTA